MSNVYAINKTNSSIDVNSWNLYFTQVRSCIIRLISVS